ncbi:MAG: radical SAM protein [Candidatus Geothermarchaeales archaeon]
MRSRANLRRVTPKDADIVYGPVCSRRLGISLGVNINLRRGKTCTFDCVYCQYGRTANHISSPHALSDWAAEEVILTEVEARLEDTRRKNQRLDSITFSGYGETTLFPRLRGLILGVKGLRDRYCPGVPVRVLTNSSLICLGEVFEALKEFDSVIAKLDVGEQKAFQAINRPAEGIPTLGEIVEGLARLHKANGRLVLQTLIFDSLIPGKPHNSDPGTLDSLIEGIRRIDPLETQIYTIARYPSEPYAVPVGIDELHRVASLINEKMGRECARVYA